MKNDCASDDELEQEISVINSQYAYLNQVLNKEAAALKIYDQILDSK